MRPVTINPQDPASALQEIERASHENDLAEIANAFTISGAFTITRTLTPSGATAAQIAAFVATLISDMQKGGSNRTT